MVKTLYLLECRDGYWWRLFPLYAVDSIEAQHKADHILGEHLHLIQEKLTEWPQGFIVYRRRLPGHIQA